MSLLSRVDGWRIAVVCAAVVLCGGLYRADAAVPPTHKLELPNGEVLVGTLVREDGVVLVFRSETLGEVRVPQAGTRLTVLAAATAEPAGQAPTWVRAQSKVEPAAPTAGHAKNPSGVARPAAAPAVKWRRMLEGGFSYQARGTLVNSTSTYLRGEVSREVPDGKVTLEGRYLFGKQNALRNTDKLDVGVKARQKFLARIDFRNELSYSFDRLKELSHQFEDVVGLNFIVSTNRRFRYSVGPGFAVQYSEPTLGDSGLKYLGNVSHDFTWQINDRVALNHTAGYLFKPGQWDDYRFRANTVLSGKVTEQASVNLRYEYEFEAIRPVAFGRSDHRVFTTLGYTF